MEAECDVAAEQAGRVAAAQAHLDRMISVESGKMVRKELADHPMVKEMDAKKIPFVETSVADPNKILPYDARRYLDIVRYFRLEAAARLAREKAGR